MLRYLFQSKVQAAKSVAIGNVKKAAPKKFVWYVVIYSIVLALPFGISFLYLPESNLNYFMYIQIFAGVAGIVHVIIMGSKFGWKNIYSFWEKIELTAAVFIVSSILSGAVLYFSPLHPFFLIFPTALMIFLLPMLFQSVFDFAMEIPVMMT